MDFNKLQMTLCLTNSSTGLCFTLPVIRNIGGMIDTQWSVVKVSGAIEYPGQTQMGGKET